MDTSLQIPRSANKQQIIEWATNQIKQGVPRQLICDQLVNGSFSLDEFHKHVEVKIILSAVMQDRNERGMRLEKQGQIEEAILLYEPI